MKTPENRIIVVPDAINAHLSFDGMRDIIVNKLRYDTRSGDYFLFCNKKRNIAKVYISVCAVRAALATTIQG